jgi:hypothetical protein
MESFNQDDYYTEIPLDEYDTDDVEWFSKVEISKISKKLKGFVYSYLYLLDSPDSPEITIKIKDEKHTFFTVFKKSDDWFFILERDHTSINTDHFKFYKCDQMEGMLKCIDDKIINHPSLKNLMEEEHKKEVNQKGLLYKWFNLFPKSR